MYIYIRIYIHIYMHMHIHVCRCPMPFGQTNFWTLPGSTPAPVHRPNPRNRFQIRSFPRRRSGAAPAPLLRRSCATPLRWNFGSWIPILNCRGEFSGIFGVFGSPGSPRNPSSNCLRTLFMFGIRNYDETMMTECLRKSSNCRSTREGFFPN